MATFIGNKIIYTADDEEPDCMICDYCECDPAEYCSNCGPEGWWQNFKHTEWLSNRSKKDTP